MYFQEVDSGKIDELLSSASKERIIPIDKPSGTTYSPKKLTATPGMGRKMGGPGHTPGPLDQTPENSKNENEPEDFFSARYLNTYFNLGNIQCVRGYVLYIGLYICTCTQIYSLNEILIGWFRLEVSKPFKQRFQSTKGLIFV